MIYVTGDCHGDWSRFSMKNFPIQKEMNRNDYVIVCGDFGIWDNSNAENYWLNWLSEKSFTLLFIDGNHSNFNLLNKFEEVDFCGGRAHKIRDNIYHLMRGYIFTIEDKRFFCMGGAVSQDIRDGVLSGKPISELKKEARRARQYGKLVRIKDIEWWEEEVPSAEEMERGLSNLSDNQVDYILTHCAPSSVAALLGYKPDVVTTYLEDICRNTKFTKWFIGHYHINYSMFNEFIFLYTDFMRIS